MMLKNSHMMGQGFGVEVIFDGAFHDLISHPSYAK